MNKLETIVALCDSIHLYWVESGVERIFQTPTEQREEWKRCIARLRVGQRVVIDRGRPPRITNE
jgi:hypothetical protein